MQFAGCGIAIPGTVFEFRAGEEKVNWDLVNKSEAIRNQAYALFEKYGVTNNPKAEKALALALSEVEIYFSDFVELIK